MKRAIARGRIVPQSRSTDPRMGRVSLKAVTLYDRMWINSDDQGRLSGDPDEIKYTACPNLPDITKDDIPDLLGELEAQGLLKVFSSSRHTAIQMLDWWEVQRLQWAYPSEYSPPEGWIDHLRYHPTPKEIITENWPPSGQQLALELLPKELPKELPSKQQSRKKLGQKSKSPRGPLPSLENEEEKEEEGGRGRGRGILPSALGSRSPPSPVSSTLFDSFPKAFGRKPNSRELAYLRDIEKEISAAGGATAEQVRDAFKEAAAQNKLHLSYVRAILLDWLGIERNRSP